jgi:uncharacterized protein (TIGR03086 family)
MHFFFEIAPSVSRQCPTASYSAGVAEAVHRYQRVADGFGRRLGGVTTEAWGLPTPCTDWTVRQLVTHVVDTHRRVLATLPGGEFVAVGADEPLDVAFAEAAAAVSAALADPARATTVVGGLFGEQPFEKLVGRLLCADTLVHTWDLARATGQDEVLDAGAVADASRFLTPIDEAIRRPGGFAPKVEPAPGADTQTELLNFCGRRP